MKVLIVTADIGAGHDLPARLLAEAIGDRAEVVVIDAVAEAGRPAQVLVRSGVETVFEHARWLFDLQYWLISRFPPSRWLGGWLAMAVGARTMLRLIARERPDVVVSTYPASTELLGRLRTSGRVQVPCVSAITDLAALRWWAHPGIDLHLITHAQSRAEVQAIAGTGADIRHVRGLVRPEFVAPPARADARAALGLPDGPVVVVSGGGWGVGDLEVAARVALGAGATVVCLCGSNERLRARLAPLGVRAEGFTTRMAEWLAAADVLVHSTAGLTILEAELCGTWAVSFGWGIGHIRLNNQAYTHFGLAAVAPRRADLVGALHDAFAAPRPRPDWFASLPEAADAVLEFTRAR